MLKIIRNILLSLAFMTNLNAAEQLSQKEIKEFEKLELFKRANIQIKQAYDTESLYLLNINVKGKADEVYLTKDKKYLIAGDVINTSNGQRLDIPVDLTNTVGKEAFTFGTGKDEYVLFTDPQCPYCKKFESYFPQIEDKVKIKVFFYPLDFHKQAKDLSMYIMSQKTQEEKVKALYKANKDLKEFKNANYSKTQKEELQKSLEKQMKVAQELGVQGTPALFDKDGNKVIWVNLLKKYNIEVR